MNSTQRVTSTYSGYPVPQRPTNTATPCDKNKSPRIQHCTPNTPCLPDVLLEKKAGTTLLTAKGKGSIKPVSPRKRFFTMLCNHCLPVDEAEQDARQRQKALNKRGQHVLQLISPGDKVVGFYLSSPAEQSRNDETVGE